MAGHGIKSEAAKMARERDRERERGRERERERERTYFVVCTIACT